MGRFQVGQSKPPGSGRRRGVRNKRSENLSVALEAVGLNIPEKIAALLPLMAPEKQADVLVGMLAFVYAKPRIVEGAAPPINNSQIVILPRSEFEADSSHVIVQLPAKDC